MYKVSIITPFHNVVLHMFKAACASMKAQTIGFENIQWIIVAHNCEPQYLPALREMLGQYPNVIIKPLDNEARTPSSPRNYGMQFATAPYVGFLDGDDSYTPNCLEEAIKAMQETESQVLCFRREFELEEEGLQIITEVVLWNQTLERIVIEQGQWDDERMFSGIWGMVTSKMFDRQFLESNHITFDEEVPYIEDCLYSALTIAKARRICYLPQLIGYHYYINGDSLVQSQKKSSETIISYARGFHKIFSTMEQLGIDASRLVWDMAIMLANFILRAGDYTTAHRQEIKQYMAPHILQARPLKANKATPQESIELSAMFAYNIIMDPEADLSAFQRNQKNGHLKLRHILENNKLTDYGQRYGFDRIVTIEGFQNRVPLTTYDNYKTLVCLQTNIGETGILTTEKANRYVMKKSGRVLPLTEHHIKPYNHAFARTLKDRHSLLLCASRPIGQPTGDMASVDSLESILVKDYITKSFYAYGRKAATLAPGMSRIFSESYEFDDYGFMLSGLSRKDLNQIVALTTSDVLRAFQVLEQHWQQMVEHIAKEDKERAVELTAILNEGFEGVARRIWPALERVVAFGAGEQQEATQALRRYIKGTPLNHGYFYTAESLIARAKGDDSDLFELILKNDFYEFIPTDTTSCETPLLVSDLQPGKSYEIIVTNKAGLYRFQSGHQITVVENPVEGKVIVKIIK